MMLLSTKTCLTLLWSTSLLFSMESMSASIPETSSIKSSAELDQTTKQMISVHTLHTATQRPADISVAPAETTAPPRVIVNDRSDSSSDGTSGLVSMNTAATTTNISGPRSLQTSTAVTTAGGSAHPSHTATASETAKPTDDQMHRHSPITSTDTTAPATPSAATLTTVAVSLPQPTSTTKPEVTSELSSTTSSNSTQAPVFIQTISSPSASTTNVTTANPTSEMASVFALTIGETFPTSTELSSSSPATRAPISTSQFPDTVGSTTTTESPAISFSTHSPISTTNVSTTNDSTSPVGIMNPHMTKSLPVLTTKSTPTPTTASCEASKSPPSTEVQPCSSRGVVRHCLIAIASLGSVATFFMVSTVVLCTKLSTRNYKVKKPQPATEMMCISSLLPERNYSYSRQRNPVSNGVLVIHGGADSDEDGGDNLTLSSFLPDNDRYV